eukprot:TRINITY_DN11448_c0_g1_i2.p1 TRINITY_DN11448_c0_g1~~TRINITY_DN11448_c0_g1_i2.p1  ORF type:complete len:351 (+),score=56.15 TRINITY_DN11448_c0_g1_i2:65-1054(+)
MKALFPFNKGYTQLGKQEVAIRTLFMRRTKAPLQIIGVSTEGMTAQEASNCVDTALNIGYKNISLNADDGHEAEVGDVLKSWHKNSDNKRTEHWYAWKLPKTALQDPNSVKQLALDAKDKMGCGYFDMVWTPFPVVDGEEKLQVSQYKALWSEVSDLRPPTAPITRHAGVTDITPSVFKAVVLRDLHEVDLVQNEVHILRQQQQLFDLGNSFDVALVANNICPHRVSTYPTMLQASKSLKLTPLQVSVCWLNCRQIPFVVNTSDPEILKDCYRLASNGIKLDKRVLAAISHLDLGVEGATIKPDLVSTYWKSDQLIPTYRDRYADIGIC